MPGSIKLEVSTEADARPTASTAPSLRGNKQTGYALGNKQTGYALALDSDKDTGSALDGSCMDAAWNDQFDSKSEPGCDDTSQGHSDSDGSEDDASDHTSEQSPKASRSLTPALVVGGVRRHTCDRRKGDRHRGKRETRFKSRKAQGKTKENVLPVQLRSFQTTLCCALCKAKITEASPLPPQPEYGGYFPWAEYTKVKVHNIDNHRIPKSNICCFCKGTFLQANLKFKTGKTLAEYAAEIQKPGSECAKTHHAFLNLRKQYLNGKINAASGLDELNSGQTMKQANRNRAALADLRTTADTILTANEVQGFDDVEEQELVPEEDWNEKEHGPRPTSKPEPHLFNGRMVTGWWTTEAHGVLGPEAESRPDAVEQQHEGEHAGCASPHKKKAKKTPTDADAALRSPAKKKRKRVPPAAVDPGDSAAPETASGLADGDQTAAYGLGDVDPPRKCLPTTKAEREQEKQERQARINLNKANRDEKKAAKALKDENKKAEKELAAAAKAAQKAARFTPRTPKPKAKDKVANNLGSYFGKKSDGEPVASGGLETNDQDQQADEEQPGASDGASGGLERNFDHLDVEVLSVVKAVKREPGEPSVPSSDDDEDERAATTVKEEPGLDVQ